MSILKIKNEQNQWIQLPVLKGPKGDSYILTEEDKQEIAELVQPSVKDVQINHNSVTTDGIANVFNTNGLYGVIVNNNGYIAIQGATEGYIKAGRSYGEPILPSYQHQSTFYGLAKAAGHDEKDSALPLGQYTDEAKSKIQTMLGIDILIAGPETDPFTSSHSIGDVFIINSKLYKALTALNAGEYINEDVNVTGVNIIELLEEDYVKKTDIATNNKLGIVKGKYGSGTQVLADGSLITAPALQDEIKAGTAVYKPVTPKTQHESVFYGLAKAAGVDMASSSNAVGTYTDAAKSAISDMLNGAVQVSGTAPTIVAKSGIRYVCGEVLSLDFTPSATGICDVVFTSGSTATVLTVPSTIKWANGFDPTSLDANTIYELNIMDGLGVAVGWI